MPAGWNLKYCVRILEENIRGDAKLLCINVKFMHFKLDHKKQKSISINVINM